MSNCFLLCFFFILEVSPKLLLLYRKDKFHLPPFIHPGSSRSGSSSARNQGPTGGPPGSGRQSGPVSQTDGAPGQRTQLQQQAQTSAARPGQPGAAAVTGPQQQPSAQVQNMGMGQGQAKPGQIGPGGGPMGQARQTGPAGVTPPTMVSTESEN